MAYITQRKMAQGLQQLVTTKGIDHTSVTAIMDTAGLRRQTFYDYFQDKYELLAWSIDDTLSETVEHNLNYLKWPAIINLVCYELEAHRQFYVASVKTQHEIDVTALIANHLAELVTHLSPTDVVASAATLIWLLCLGIAQSLIHNLLTNHPRDYEELATAAVTAIQMTLKMLAKG
ncbi:dihydroxyacetone kinase transcriptional activator DhaS [Lactiplantibacillus mudanjiangensis]|uniref:TetR family transcriptional regulator [Lactobacillus paraplantarum] n=1 Tax=Lactiplantibacillus mudanjiangensis TaxID=1296538 RepID=A0A660E4M5_9LACO|nr:dihydroxyacetone kinase transcriptional activator DhaS [Lactiplantibacillus mudanjiangensis]VDG21257.1 TetR family transcriptional regulator [Lactobacillus paraplantarum] [Lactiplantibacillus mudanjiangensis]VDG22485.1 TetR family transcriptional regulator [Lactobacillus paraplantarum] [Lactiplantibacillus mudanjiangensis]VDG26973.1 TetR family transcriptional regulator [Lactobacillus paraplantarum] [Lactiplantibacillus mudanjiangensis]VDG32084.1 TetR family transcriptional regulator [Lactob